MRSQRITVAELSKIGSISRTAIYKAIRSGVLSWDGAADPVKLLAEWRRKRDPSRDGKIGPALERVIRKLGLAVPPEHKPKATVVPDAPAIDANGAPMHLSAEMRRFWGQVTDDYELERSALLVLKTACEAHDRAQDARRVIANEGMIVNNRRHAAIDVEATAQGLFLRAMRQLGLDIEQAGPVGRPIGR
jgi:hypothetical protein